MVVCATINESRNIVDKKGSVFMNKMLVLLVAAVVAVAVWFYAGQSNDTPSELPGQILTREAILQASDLQEGIKNAVVTQDEKSITQWMNRAADVALEAGLSESDVAYIRSDSARDFMIFSAKRSLFNDAFEEAYYALEEIEPLKAQYPEARDFFAHADELINARDDIIEKIAAELAEGESPSEAAIEYAKGLWKQRFTAMDKAHIDLMNPNSSDSAN